MVGCLGLSDRKGETNRLGHPMIMDMPLLGTTALPLTNNLLMPLVSRL